MAYGKFHGGVTTTTPSGSDVGLGVLEEARALGVVAGEVDGLGHLGVALHDRLARLVRHARDGLAPTGRHRLGRRGRGARGAGRGQSPTASRPSRAVATASSTAFDLFRSRGGRGGFERSRWRPTHARLAAIDQSVSGSFSNGVLGVEALGAGVAVLGSPRFDADVVAAVGRPP